MQTSLEERTNIPEEGREVKQVTDRDYDTYIDMFNLPEEVLAKAKIVVDVGAGLSSFTQEARKKFPGLKAIAVDPIYKRMKSGLLLPQEQFEKEERVFFDFVSSDRWKSSDYFEGRTKEYYDRFVALVRESSGEYLGSSHQAIALENSCADLVLASNSILRVPNKPTTVERAFKECLRILKEDGEIRVAGGIVCLAFEGSSGNVELWYNGDWAPNSPEIEDLKRIGHTFDPELLRVFQGLERSGAHFYGVIARGEVDGKIRYRFDTLIIRKDDAKPEIKFDDKEKRCRLVRLDFEGSDGFNIPTTFLTF